MCAQPKANDVHVIFTLVLDIRTTMSKRPQKPKMVVSDITYIRARIQSRFETNLITNIIPEHILTKYPSRVAEISPILFAVIILRSFPPYGAPVTTTDEGQELFDALYSSIDFSSVGKGNAFHQIFQVMWFKLTLVNPEACKKHRATLNNNAKSFITEKIQGTTDWLRMLCEYVITGDNLQTQFTSIMEQAPPSEIYTVDISNNNSSTCELPSLDDLLNADTDWSSTTPQNNILMSTNLE